jgi:hypothetical protein
MGGGMDGDSKGNGDGNGDADAVVVFVVEVDVGIGEEEDDTIGEDDELQSVEQVDRTMLSLFVSSLFAMFAG